MIKEKELKEEKANLKETFSEIQQQKCQMKKTLEEYKKNLYEQIKYSVDAFYNMDEEEISATKTMLENEELEVLRWEDIFKKMALLEKSAYFGRIDFNNAPYYIGISSLLSKEKLYISDWRAPVSSLYYDFELGNAKYDAPEGEISGEITKKRQYKVERDCLVYAFDSSLTIGDEILKETLSSNASEKMKNIVSTIQREQNKIIRAPESRNILIQGEAGSGKTSIALHRAAYLMYKKARRLAANDIMIISPNKLFSEYISNVLPELGERNIIETTFNHLASKELPKIKLLGKEESISKALNDVEHAKNIAYKNSFKFFDDLKVFLDNFSFSNFQPVDIKFGNKAIKKEVIEELYSNKYKTKKVSVRLGWISEHIMDELQLPKEIYKRVLSVVYNMFSKKTMIQIYADFLKGQGIAFTGGNVASFEDVPAILYIKDYILGLTSKQSVKYLLVDEMQDYNPIHYDILNKLFDCNKLILGDINQSIFDMYWDEKDLIKLTEEIGSCDLVKLTKSYRSTYEISKFCQRIKKLDYDVVDRHGKPVDILFLKSEEEEVEKIVQIFKAASHKKVALICKTRDESKKYYELLKDRVSLTLMDGEIDAVADKFIISSADSKGIEFDVVIIPNVSKQNYSREWDKNILYISATRALHELYLTSFHEMPDFL